MGYPTAYRTSAARLSRGTQIFFEIPKRQKTPPPDRATRARIMRDITQVADVPPLGFSDLWPLFRMLRRLGPWGRLIDLYDLLKWLNGENGARQFNKPANFGSWHLCWTGVPSAGYTLGPLYCYRGGAYGVDVPSWLDGFGDNDTQQGASFSNLPWVYINWKNPNTNAVQIRGGMHQPANIGFDPISPPSTGWFPSRNNNPLAYYRWVNPLKWTPIVDRLLDPFPEPPPAWNTPPRTDPNRETGYEKKPKAYARENLWPVEVPLTTRQPVLGRTIPPKGTKEKKFKATTMARIVARALKSTAFVDGKMKDLRDLLEAMHDSLPKELQLKGRDKRQIEKLFRRVWENLDKMDAKEAFLGILKEIVEDLIGGFADGLRSKAASKNGWFKNKIHTQPRF